MSANGKKIVMANDVAAFFDCRERTD